MTIKIAIGVLLLIAGVSLGILYAVKIVGRKNTAKLLALGLSAAAYGALLGWLLLL